jgi:eukaryotic-like serine/threonine-protein kinase
MSLEQIEGKEADAGSDIFPSGAVLYEMATGKRAFQGKTHLSTASSILAKDPDPIWTVQPLAPKALVHIVRTCLAKGAEDRFQDAHDLTLQLHWLTGAGAEPPVAGSALKVALSKNALAPPRPNGVVIETTVGVRVGVPVTSVFAS